MTSQAHATPHQPPAETEVCIIGGGPVGSALAIDLRLRGIACVVVERETRVSYDMRAMNNDMRTMELLRRWGVADELRGLNPVPAEFQRDICFCTALHGDELGVWPAYGWRPEDAGGLAAEAGQPISQKHTARVLRRRAEELGAVMALGWECADVEQDGDEVTARLVAVEGGATAGIRASYLVGCDGGRSTVRSAIGIDRSGAGGLGKHLHVVVGCPGLLTEPTSRAAFYIVFNPVVGGLVLPSEEDEFNFHLAGFDPDDDVTGLDLERLAQAVTGLDTPMEIKSVSPYLIHELIAETYRSGRALIAGDAAHLFCPFGGFNMNTGIGDAANLAWKLAGCVRGWGGDALLDSYGDERRPIALRNCAEATFNVNALVAAVHDVVHGGIPDGRGPQADADRRAVGEELYRRTFREWNVFGAVLDQRYASAVVVDDGSAVPDWDVTVYHPSAKPGHRAPHAWLDEGVSLYDVTGLDFALLDFGAAESDRAAIVEAAAQRGLPLTEVRIDDPALRAVYDASLVLVRPDQHVAWRGDVAPPDPGRVIDVVRGAAPVGADRNPIGSR